MKCLDPNDLGRINFKDFCRGVFAMKGEVLLEILSSEGNPVQLGGEHTGVPEPRVGSRNGLCS